MLELDKEPDELGQVISELSILAMYSRLGMNQASGLAEISVIPQLASEGLAVDAPRSSELLPLAILSPSAPPIDIAEALADVAEEWHGPQFLDDERQIRLLLTAYWAACVANFRSDALELIRLIRFVGVGYLFSVTGSGSGARGSVENMSQLHRVWSELDSIEHEHEHDGRPYSAAGAARLADDLVRAVPLGAHRWVIRGDLRYLQPAADPTWY